MRRIADLQLRPLPEDVRLSIATLEEMFVDTRTVLNDLRKTVVEAPATASSTGLEGQIAYDSDYIYVCVAPDTWKRAALSTW